MEKKFLKLSLITFIVGIVFLALAYFSFHYLTDAGLSSVWHKESEKPFVTELIGDFGIINLACSFISLLIYFVFGKKKDE